MATTGTTNYSRTTLILVKGGTKLTRKLFEKRVKDLSPEGQELTIDDFLLKHKSAILQEPAGKNRERLLFPTLPAKTDIEKWDLYMFCFVLIKTCALSPTLRMYVEKLQKLRNKLFHMNDPTLGECQYEAYMDKIGCCFKKCLDEINDADFSTELNDFVKSVKHGSLALEDTLRLMHAFYKRDDEHIQILENHSKDHEELCSKMDKIMQKLESIDSHWQQGNSVDVPAFEIAIKVKNCTADKEAKVLEFLGKRLNELINVQESSLEDDVPNVVLHEIREILQQALKDLFALGRHIIRVEQKCILLHIKCTSVTSFISLYRDYRRGRLTRQLLGLQTALRLLDGFEDVEIDTLIYQGTFWKGMDELAGLPGHHTLNDVNNYPDRAKEVDSVACYTYIRLQEKSSFNVKEESKKCEMPTIDRPHDGRLITLSSDELKGLLDNCERDAARKGGFGEVSFSKTKVPGLDIRVAIKMIDCREKNEDYVEKMRSASNEKIASRVMHFAIVPLIAYMDEELEDNRRVFYFISPYFENGSLLEVLAHDKQCSSNDIHLSSFRRKRILFQIASALDYLHTPVPGSRGIILHMDLSSTNIVLDNNWNARLIDFGLAREMNEGQSWITQTTKFGKKGYWPTANYSKLRVHEDYYNFGVVTRELLTGVAPFINEEKQLRKSSEMIIEMQLQKNIWTDKKEASVLIKLSTRCLKSREDGNVSSANIVNELKTMLQNASLTRNTSTCDLCIVNLAVEPKRAPPHQCIERANVCTSCMRNSHVNPIRCPRCNDTVIPKIGHTYAAVLIAGNDEKNEGLAKSFRSDVLALKDVLASKCPCVMGIRDENIKLIAPSSPGKTDKLNLQVHEAFCSLESKQNFGTLLVYFTGHYFPDKGFILGGQDDVLTLTEIQDELINIYTQWGETVRIFMFLDCCKAPYVLRIPELHVKMIQINACRPDDSCYQAGCGSNFRKFFCQALTRKAYNKNCSNSNSSSSETECEDCVMSGDIITVQQLLTYISNHMNKCYYGKDPILYVYGITSDDSCMGYNVDFVVNLKFMFKEESGPTTDVVIKHKLFCDIKSLKEHILDTVLGKTASDGKLKLTPVEFSDAVALHIHDGSQHGLELRSMQNVSWALDGKREIVACYRTLPNILKGLVVVFIETTYITEYLSSMEFLVEQANGMEAIFSFEGLYSRYKETDNEIDSTSSNMSQDKKEALRRFRDELLKVIEKWDQTDDKDSRELKILFPCLTDNKWHDFMLMDLSVCQNS